MDDLSQLTAIIKTFQRPRALARLIRSIRRFYPRLAIAVADDGVIPSPRDDVDYLRLPTDIGLSAGRNALLRHVRTPYFLLLDDDLEFNRRTRVERLLDLVARGEVDIAAGDYHRCKRKLFFIRRRWQPFHGIFRFQEAELWLLRATLATFPDYQLCDVVHNFFVGRKADIVALGGWDEELKLNEHVEFFVRVRRRGMRVAYCKDVVARHWMDHHPDYARYRDRDFTDIAAKKIGVRRINRFDERPDASGSSQTAAIKCVASPHDAISAADGARPNVPVTRSGNQDESVPGGGAGPQIAVILSTYQRPDHLQRSLLSLTLQRGMEGRFEVVVTDDGSTDHTEDMVRRFAQKAAFPITFATHEHRGFHLARCRNEGALATSAAYLLFSDGDCLFPPDHLQQHLRARRPSTAWSGDCLHLDEQSTGRIDDAIVASGAYRGWVVRAEQRRLHRRWLKDRVYQAIGHRKKPKLTGCNIAVWRSDFERINGFDERFTGWGCEDDDLADRLRRSGVRIASILGFTHVFHLWHPSDPSRPAQWANGANVDYLLRRDKPIRCLLGLSAHEPSRRVGYGGTHVGTSSGPPSRAAA